MKVVGVIGGGAAGLCAARHILATDSMIPMVWEISSQIGGTWVYTPKLGKDEHGLPIHSSMYKNLKTNLPKEVMAFPDFPFPSGEESFLHHTEICKYLERYAEHYNLHPHIKFNHHVEQVTPVMKDEGPPSWAVTVKDLLTKNSSTTICDAIIVCNGHYSIPQIPQIKDIEKFKGRQIHSHEYREPFPYKGSRVVVLGAGASGLDIAMEISSVAKNVLLSHNMPAQIPSELPPNVRQVRGIVSAFDNGFVFGDGSSVEADVIMYCTGYKYSFPFLTDECGITIEDNIVKPLYKHLINIDHPSMAFIGIPFMVCPFPLFDFQVQFFVKTLSGDLSLPNKKEMDKVTQKELETMCSKGIPIRYFHKMGTQQWQYNDDLACEAGVSCIPRAIPKLYEAIQYFVAAITGKLTLPSRKEMEADTMSELHCRQRLGYVDKHFHKFGLEKQNSYMNEIQEQTGIPPLTPSFMKCFQIVIIRLIFSFQVFKKYQYTFLNDGNVKEVCNGKVVNTYLDLGWLLAKQITRLLWRDFRRVVKLMSSMMFTTVKKVFDNEK